MLVRSGIILVKYWFSVSDDEQERRFQARVNDPMQRWKLSPMDLKSREKWVEYSRAKDEMFTYTDIKQAPWYVVNADDKRRARLNCITPPALADPLRGPHPGADQAAAAPDGHGLRAPADRPTRPSCPSASDSAAGPAGVGSFSEQRFEEVGGGDDGRRHVRGAAPGR